MAETPLRFLGDEVFARVRDLFVRLAFNEDSIEERAAAAGELPGFYDDGLVPAGADAVDLLTGLFLRAGSGRQHHIVQILGQQGFEDLCALGLLISGDGEGYFRASYRIRPMYGMYVLSDMWDASGKRHGLPDDVVMAPDLTASLSFLSYVPHTPCRLFLEACGGAGMAALVAAQRYAGRAYSFDITERSTLCANFTARLNALTDFEARCGDTYEPADGLQFDRIVAHPPYVPVFRHTWIYHSGGSDGEQIQRRHIEDLPKVLAPGGRFYCRTLGTDRRGQPFEQRVRAWLGEQAEEYDIAVTVLRTQEPMQIFTQSLLNRRIAPEDVPIWQQQMDSLGIENFVAVLVVIQRHEEPRPAFTVRRTRSPYSGPAEIDWLVDWETLRSKGQAESIVLDQPLAAAPVSQYVRREIHQGEWRIVSRTLSVNAPFACELDIDVMAAFLLTRCDGTRTGTELLQALVDDGMVRPDASAQRFATVLSELVSTGSIHVRGHEPPAPAIHPDPDFS